MKLTIPCEGSDKIRQLFNVLEDFKFNSLKLQIDSNYLPQHSKAKLFRELEKLQVEFQEAQDDEDDGEDPLNDSNLNFSTSISRIDDPNTITKSISDKYIFRFFCLRKFKANLCATSEKKGINITSDADNYKLTFQGPKSGVDEFVKEINTICYEKSNKMSYSQGQCLKSTNFLFRLKKANNILDTIIIPEENGDLYQIIAYGNDQSQVEKFINSLNKICENTLILLDISNKYQYSNESELILQYLKNSCRKKCKDIFEQKKIPPPEILMVEDKKYERHIFFMFVDCGIKTFKQIQSWFDKDMASLSILNIKLEKDQQVPIKVTGVCEEKINSFKLKDDSLLLLGKEKIMIKSLKDLLGKESFEKSVSQYRLQLKKLHQSELFNTQTHKKYIPIEEYTKNCGSLVVKTFFDRNIYVFCLLPRWQDLEKILTVHQNFVRNASWNVGSSKNSSVMTSTEKILPDEEVKKETKTTPTNKNQTTKISLKDHIDNNNNSPKIVEVEKSVKQPESSLNMNIPLKNMNPEPFNLDDIPSDDLADIQDQDPRFTHIANLLKTNYPKTEDFFLLASHDAAKWEKYVKSRQQNLSEDIQEFTVFYESKQNPSDLIDEANIPIREVENHIVASFNHQRDLHYIGEDENYDVLVLLVLVKNKGKGQLVDFYPFAIASFK